MTLTLEEYESPEYAEKARETQRNMIDRLNAIRARMLAEMSEEDRAFCLTLPFWHPEPYPVQQ